MTIVAEIVATPTKRRFLGGKGSTKPQSTTNKSVSIYVSSPDDFRGSFHAVLIRWRTETRFLSDPELIMQHPSFLALVKNAKSVRGMICAELEREPSNLVWVFEESYDFDPYEPDDSGDVVKQSERWLNYFSNNG
jgi:hypothetical protein